MAIWHAFGGVSRAPPCPRTCSTGSSAIDTPSSPKRHVSSVQTHVKIAGVPSLRCPSAAQHVVEARRPSSAPRRIRPTGKASPAGVPAPVLRPRASRLRRRRRAHQRYERARSQHGSVTCRGYSPLGRGPEREAARSALQYRCAKKRREATGKPTWLARVGFRGACWRCKSNLS